MIGPLLRRLRDEDGVSLVEVLATSLVLATGILPAITVFQGGQENGATAQNVAIASQAATEAIEELRALPYAALDDGPVEPRPTSGDIAERLTADRLEVPGGGTEAIVRYQVTTETVGTGVAQRTLRVHRFVTQRTETCPIVDVDAMIAGLSAQLTARRAQVSSLRTAATSLESEAAAKSTQLLAPTYALIAGITGLRSQLDEASAKAGSIRGTLATIGTALDGLDTQLAALQTAVEGDPDLGGAIDPCQLPDESVIPDLTLLSNALSASEPHLTTLASRVGSTRTTVASINGLTGAVVSTLASTLSNHNANLVLVSTSLGASYETSGSSITFTGSASGSVALGSEVTRTTAHVQDLQTKLVAGNPGNSLRVTSAVEVLGRAEDVGPDTPTWEQTVVTNPLARTL